MKNLLISLLRMAAVLGICVLVGVVFMSAAISKARDHSETLAVFVYLLPSFPGLAQELVRGLIVFELMLGALLITGVGRRFTLCLAFSVLTLFSAWLVWLIVTDTRIGCGCGVRRTILQSGDARWDRMITNAVLMGGTVIALALDRMTSRSRQRDCGHEHARISSLYRHNSQGEL